MGGETTFVNRCSLVVRAVDLWSGTAPAQASIRVRIRGIERAPLRTSDGSYAFLDYPGDKCLVTVHSPDYLPYEREVSLGDGVPILTAALMPSRLRAVPPVASGLRFKIVGEASGKPVGEAEVLSYVEDDRAVAGRVSEDSPEGGAGFLRVSPDLYKLLPGESFVVRGKDGRPEWHRVSEYSDPGGNGGELRLEAPLSRACSRGEKLLPAVRTRSEADGTVTLPFRGILPAEFQVVVEAGTGKGKVSLRLTGAGGEVRGAPEIRLK